MITLTAKMYGKRYYENKPIETVVRTIKSQLSVKGYTSKGFVVSRGKLFVKTETETLVIDDDDNTLCYYDIERNVIRIINDDKKINLIIMV